MGSIGKQDFRNICRLALPTPNSGEVSPNSLIGMFANDFTKLRTPYKYLFRNS